MKKVGLLLVVLCTCQCIVRSQTMKTELYDLVKKLLFDSTGYENVGEWAVGQPKKFPVTWKEDALTMSADTSINFFRTGTVNLAINGKTFTFAGKPLTWRIMLKGPRMGYTSFSIISTPTNELQPQFTVDSLFGKRSFASTLVKSCDNTPMAGFYYYQLKLPKKDMFFLKSSWISVGGKTAIRIDGYDNSSSYAAKLDCPK